MNFSIGNDWASNAGAISVIIMLAFGISVWHYNAKDRPELDRDHAEAERFHEAEQERPDDEVMP